MKRAPAPSPRLSPRRFARRGRRRACPVCARPPSSARRTSRFRPSTAPPPIDEAERKIEAAQKSGLLARSRFSLAGLPGRASAASSRSRFGLWTTSLIEGLFAKAESLGMIGLAFGLLFSSASSASRRARSSRSARQTRIAEMHVAFAHARAADDRDAARRLVAQLVALYRDRPETARARAEVEDAARAIIDGRDLIDVAERALLRPLDQKGARRDRRRRQARVAGDRDQPARDPRRRSSSSPRSCDWCGGSPRSTAAGPACSASSGSPARSAPISPSPAAWRSATACCSRWSATASPRASRPEWAKACSTACSPRASACRRWPSAARRPSAVDKAPGVAEVAPFLFSGGKGE